MRSSSRGLQARRATSITAWTPAYGGFLGELAIGRRLLGWMPIWLLLVCFLLGLVVAYQVPHSYSVDVGSPQDQAYVHNFHTRLAEPGHVYRWSDVYGYVSFPGLGGSRPFTVSLELDPARTAPVTIIVNGAGLFSQTLRPGWQTIILAVDATHPSALASRDTVLEVRAPDFRTEDAPGEPKGVKIGTVRVEQADASGFISPPYSRAIFLEAAIVLVYLFVGRALLGITSLHRSRVLGLLVALIGSAGLIAWLFDSPVAVAAATPHLVITGASMLTLLVLGERIVGRLKQASFPTVAGRGLAVWLAVGFGLRYGGMALPQSVIIDMPWHMKWLETLAAGNWQALYFPSAEGLSSVPREWGLDVLIPKSPLFYFAAAPLSILPFDLETSVKWFVCFIDATLVLAVFWLALRLGASNRAAVWASALYALMPLAFRAFAYGILPTIFAQWLAVGAFIALLRLGERTWGVVQWIALTLLVTLAFLAFPTVAAFVTLVLLVVSLVWGLDGKSRTIKGPQYGHWRTWHIPLLVAVAWALAVWAYYGLYISPVLTSVGALLAPKTGGGTTVRWPGGFLELVTWTGAYVVSVLPALLGLLGLALAFGSQTTGLDRRRALWLVAAWAGIAPLFVLVNYRVDMIGKHLFFTMVPLAVAGGVALWQIGRRGRLAALLAGLALLTIGWQGLIFWIERLVRAST